MAGPQGGGRFVGRRHELRVLGGMIAEVAAGGSAAVSVVGEPGIGKTRLTGELATRAEAAGFQVLGGRGSEFEQDVPFGLAVDALDERFGSLAPELLARLGDERVAELATVFPSMAGAARRLSSSLEIERFRSHHAVRGVLEQMAKARPVLLVFDDLHWADPASLELVAHLLRRAVAATMLVIVHRSHTLLAGTALGRAAQDAGVRTLELGPLPMVDLAESIGDRPDSTRARALYGESGGNPFYFTELARVPAAQNVELLPAGTNGFRGSGGAVPSAVRMAMHRELYALSAVARRFVQAAAVTGEPFDVDLTAVVAETGPATLGALDELVNSNIVQPTGIPGRMVFRHPIVRRAVYETTGHGWRLGAHRRAAAELSARGGTGSAHAHHVERSASPGDEEAIALLARAGHAAAARAPSAAARWFAGAVRLLPPAAAASRQLELLIPLAAAHAAAGRPHESREVLEKARAHVTGGDLAARGRITTLLAAAEQALGRSEQARDLLTEALTHARAGTPEAVALTIELATNHIVRGDWDEAVRVAAAATSAAERLGDRALVAAATVASGFALLNVGDSAIAAARRCTQRASDIFAALPDGEVSESHLTTLATLALVEALFRNWAPAQRHAERGLRLCRESGRGDAFIPFTLVLSSAATMRGDLNEAGPLVDSAVEAAVLMDNDQWLAPAEGMRCWMFTQQGRMIKALAAGANAVRAAERAPRSMFWWTAPAYHAVALIEAGRHEQGRAELYRVGGPTLAAIPPTSRPYWLTALVNSHLATGELPAAQELVELMERTELEVGQRLHSGEICSARASVLLAAGDPAGAARAALEAAGFHDAGEMHIDAARARLLAGRALVAGGDPAAGARELTRAHEALAHRGAARLADRAAKELRSLGLRVSQRSKPRGAAGGVESLSDRELEVAEGVAQGRTNRQIAGELFISPKTVEAHLARAYAKLGVRSRAAMVAILTRSREPDR